MSENKHIMIVAGEASGDMHASHLVKALKEKDPSFVFSGLGGPKMSQAGVEIYRDLTQVAVVGFIEVLKHYGEFKQAFDLILRKIKEVRPACVVLIDYPGFNLRLAKEVKRLGIKVIYYISPQVWAWKKNRINMIKKCVDRMLVLFWFEYDLYTYSGVKVSFVGHPLVDQVQVTKSKTELLESLGFHDYKFTIGLLPGSRTKEVELILPPMIEACEILSKEFPLLQFLVLRAPSIPRSLIDPHIPKTSKYYRILDEDTYNGVNACEVCMVASGTATLETAILQKPMVIIYKTSLLTWALAKLLVRIPYIGLVNIVAGKKIVPECIQYDANGVQIATLLKEIFTNEIKVADIKFELKAVKDSLGQPGASMRAAEEIIKDIA